MVRIAHISDSHLGAAMFQLVERKQDMRDCFKKAVKMALRHEPDILVHTGDLFDSPEPAHEDMQVAIEMFRLAKEQGVRSFVVQGNHDIVGQHRANSPIALLEQAGLITTTGKEQHRRLRLEFDGEEVEIHLVSWGYKQRTTSLINGLEPEGDISLLFAHTTNMSWDELPNFDYIGVGHYHTFKLDEDAGVGCPGSTAVVKWENEVGRGRTRKLIVVDITEEGIRYQTETLNDVREFKVLQNVDITGMSPKSANDEIMNRLSKLSIKKPGAVVIVQVCGDIDTETCEAIKRTELSDYGMDKHNALVTIIDPKWRVTGARPIPISKPLDVKNSVREYIEKTGEGDPEELLGLLEDIMGGK